MKLSEYIKEVLYDTMLTVEEKYIKINKYVHFVTQPLTLSMFIPAKLVNGKWEVLEEPSKGYDFDSHNLHSAKEEYQQALDNLVFKGFEYSVFNDGEYKWNRVKGIYYDLYFDNDKLHFPATVKTIEDIIENVEFTDKVKKQFNI